MDVEKKQKTYLGILKEIISGHFVEQREKGLRVQGTEIEFRKLALNNHFKSFTSDSFTIYACKE